MESRALLSMDKVFDDLEDWLQEMGITLEECDMLEHFLLDKAEIKQFGSCRFSWGGEGSESRVSFSIGGLSNVDARKFLLFLHAMGDKKAHIVTSYFGEDRPENKFNDGGRCIIRRKPCVSFRGDGLSFAINILPLFKAHVLTAFKSNPGLLKPYQDKSGIFAEGEESINTRGTLFYSPPAARLPRAEEPSQAIQSGLRNVTRS